MDTQYNINILLLCLFKCPHYWAITNGWPEWKRKRGRERREVNYSARKLFVHKVLALNKILTVITRWEPKANGQSKELVWGLEERSQVAIIKVPSAQYTKNRVFVLLIIEWDRSNFTFFFFFLAEKKYPTRAVGEGGKYRWVHHVFLGQNQKPSLKDPRRPTTNLKSLFTGYQFIPFWQSLKSFVHLNR